MVREITKTRRQNVGILILFSYTTLLEITTVSILANYINVATIGQQ